MKSLVSRVKRGWPTFLLLPLGVALGGLMFGTGSGSDEHEAMLLVPSADEHAGHVSSKAKSRVWTCAMHPQIQQSEPGQCPLCGMDLIPVSESAGDSLAVNQVALSERAKALVKLRTSMVMRQGGAEHAAGEIRLLGRVEQNESTLRTVTAWTGGRIDRLHVRTTGERIYKGQAIATLYSPEVFAAHQDLIVAKRQISRMSSAVEGVQAAAQQALEATRERLGLLGLPAKEVARLEGLSTPIRETVIRSPFSGTVMDRIATEGAYIQTGAPLYKISNLSSLWVQLDAYESDLSKLKVGQSVRIEVEALAPETFEGKLTFIDPTLDPKKRTARVRVEVKNSDGRLRPGMFAQAVVASHLSHDDSVPLTVPASAVLFTGRRSVVYVEMEATDSRSVYEPRTIRLGPRTGQRYPVVAGLSEGERIVTRGAFALDADLQIRGGPSMMSLPDDTTQGVWDEIVQIDSATRAKLAPTLEHYLTLQKALATDDLPAAKSATKDLLSAATVVEITKPPEAVDVWGRIRTGLTMHSKHVIGAPSLEQARTGFEALSEAVTLLVRTLGNPLKKELFVAFCPMASGSQGASWIQEQQKIDNSYLGESMRSCGEVKSRISAGAHLAQPGKTKPKPQAPAGGHNH